MNFTQSFKLAIKSLLLSKMRALLTMLGIIIGVAAVIIITSLAWRRCSPFTLPLS